MAHHNPKGTMPRWWELVETVRLAWQLFTDRRVTPLLKLIPLVAAIYVLLPVDISPDVIPIVGQVDDLAVLLGALHLFIRLCPSEAVAQYREAVSAPTDHFEDDVDVIDGEWRSIDVDEEWRS